MKINEIINEINKLQIQLYKLLIEKFNTLITKKNNKIKSYRLELDGNPRRKCKQDPRVVYALSIRVENTNNMNSIGTEFVQFLESESCLLFPIRDWDIGRS